MSCAAEIKAQYEWIYNPPPTAGDGQNTIGSEARKDFAEYYGGYMELSYLLTNGDFTKFDDIMEWDIHRFLFQGEYLLRKKQVENLK